MSTMNEDNITTLVFPPRCAVCGKYVKKTDEQRTVTRNGKTVIHTACGVKDPNDEPPGGGTPGTPVIERLLKAA